MSNTETIEAQNTGTEIPGESAPQTETRDTSDVETRARAQGWVPKEEFRGPAEKWRDAESFVKRGEEELPILRERARTMERKLADLETKLSRQDQEYKGNLTNLERMTGLALTRQREQIVGSYEAAMREAASTGDITRYDQLRRDMGESVQRFDHQYRTVRDERPQPQAQQTPPDVQTAVSEFRSRNAWFESDPALNMEAQAIHIALNRDRPEMSIQDNLTEVERVIKSRYPQRFGIAQPKPTAPVNAVESGASGRVASSMSRGKGAADLPGDARAQGEKFVNQGLFKELSEYAREYFAQ